MSLFGSLMGDFEEDPIFGHHMRSMRQMNSMMNSMFADPFGAFDAMNGLSAITNGGFAHQQQNRQMAMPTPFGGGLMPFGFPAMPNMNRLLSVADGNHGASFSSSSVISMSHGPDGRPLVYQATSSTKTGPGGIRETQKTVQDSRTGVKKMAIGHHIGERAHIIEREQNLRSGQHEERQDFINLEEEEAEDFDREFTQKSRHGMRLSNAIREVTDNGNGSRRQLPAIMPAQNSTSTTTTENATSDEPEIILPPSPTPPPAPTTATASHSRRAYRNDKSNRFGKNQTIGTTNLATPRRPLRTPTSSPLTMGSGLDFIPSRSSIHPHPYNVSPSGRRHHRSMKGKTTQSNHQNYVQIEELPDDYEEGATANTQQK